MMALWRITGEPLYRRPNSNPDSDVGPVLASGSKTWVVFEGKAAPRPFWGGQANMDEYEADSPSGHIEGMTVRTYNTASHEWSIY
jgi:hypothetical protein